MKNTSPELQSAILTTHITEYIHTLEKNEYTNNGTILKLYAYAHSKGVSLEPWKEQLLALEVKVLLREVHDS